MAVSTRTRFEVFKRDGFTCCYCGRNRDGDGVKLHVDHVIPVAEGGSDSIENLVTACQDCNLGKAANLLDERAPVPDIAGHVATMRAKREKLREYAQQKAIEEAATSMVWNHWFDVWGVSELDRWRIPYRSTLQRYVAELGCDEVKDAMNITAERFPQPSNNAVKYVYGVLRRKLAELEGRVTACIYCKRRIVVEHGEDATLDWWHRSCEEQALRDAEEAEAQADEEAEAQADDLIADEDEISLEVAAWDALAEAAGL